MKWVWMALGAVCVVGLGAAAWLRHKVRTFSRRAFGTADLSAGLARQAEELANTPKSVSGMTRVYLPQIEHDFPSFNYFESRQQAQQVLLSALQAITQQEPSCLPQNAQGVREQLRVKLADDAADGKREAFAQVEVHDIQIANYLKRQGTCRIVWQAAAGYLHTLWQDGQRVDGAQAPHKEQTKYNIEQVYVQDVQRAQQSGTAVGVTCPHCGAPITQLGDKQCAYCGGAVQEVNWHVWTFQRVEQV